MTESPKQGKQIKNPLHNEYPLITGGIHYISAVSDIRIVIDGSSISGGRRHQVLIHR